MALIIWIKTSSSHYTLDLCCGRMSLLENTKSTFENVFNCLSTKLKMLKMYVVLFLIKKILDSFDVYDSEDEDDSEYGDCDYEDSESEDDDDEDIPFPQ